MRAGRPSSRSSPTAGHGLEDPFPTLTSSGPDTFCTTHLVHLYSTRCSAQGKQLHHYRTHMTWKGTDHHGKVDKTAQSRRLRPSLLLLLLSSHT